MAKQCNEESAQEAGGMQTETDTWRQKLEQIPRQLKRLRKAGLKKQSVTDPDSRFLRTRAGFELGYTADIAVSEDHLIVGQRITQNPTDTKSLSAMVEQVEQRCGETPRQVSADSGFYRNQEIEAVTARGVDAYVPDSNLAQELNGGRWQMRRLAASSTTVPRSVRCGRNCDRSKDKRFTEKEPDWWNRSSAP